MDLVGRGGEINSGGEINGSSDVDGEINGGSKINSGGEINGGSEINSGNDVDGADSLLINALALADFSEKFQTLPEGLNTELTREFSEGGAVLSGGESQKVAISRLFTKPEALPFAILDEPSSALDPVAEYHLNRAMAAKAERSSIIFISHRLSATRSADRIYMFEKGEIAEEGSHDELMALGGKYAEMFEKQAYYYKLKA